MAAPARQDLTITRGDTEVIEVTITTDGTGDIIETDGVASTGLNLTDAYDLMGHSYELEFTTLDLQSVSVTIDGQTGCCAKFTTLKPLVGAGEIALSTGGCND